MTVVATAAVSADQMACVRAAVTVVPKVDEMAAQ